MKSPTNLTAFRIQTSNDKEVVIEATDAFAALGKHRKRGVNGLGKNWTLTRQPDGWIVAVNSAGRTLERGYHRLKEVNWTRNGDQKIRQ